MAIDWEIHGREFGNCNCTYGCPCQFEALPTYGNCEGTAFIQIDKGHFDDVSLDGLKMGVVYSWPKSIPEGNGRLQGFIDSTANEAQRKALLTILKGEEADEFSNAFCIYTAMCSQIYDPIFAEIEFEMDMEKRTGKCAAHGFFEAAVEPIIGVAGNEHRAQIHLAEGVEFRMAEMGRGRCRIQGNIELELDDGYGQLNEVHFNRHGWID